MSGKSLRARHEKGSGKEFAPAPDPRIVRRLAAAGCVGTYGSARAAARRRISRSTIGNSAASPEMIQSKTSLRSAVHATRSSIGDLLNPEGRTAIEIVVLNPKSQFVGADGISARPNRVFRHAGAASQQYPSKISTSSPSELAPGSRGLPEGARRTQRCLVGTQV